MLPWNKRLLKKLDRVLAAWAYSCLRLRNPAPVTRTEPVETGRGYAVPVEAVKHILVIRPGGLGDAVLTFPMIHALGKYYRKARVDVLAEKRNADIYAIHSRVRRVYCYDTCMITTVFRLRRNRYDVVIDTEQFHHLSILAAAVLGSEAVAVCGFDSPIRRLFLTHPVAYDKSMYEAVSFLNLAQAVTGKPFTFDKDSPFMEIPQTYRHWAEKIVGAMKTPDIVTIAPGATAKDRMWPCDRYIRIIRWLIQNGLCVLILGGNDALGISETMSREFDRGTVRNLSGQTSLPQSAALIQRARAHLSSDTGILHVAYAVGTLTISLFGPGLHDKWAPRGRRHVLLRAGLACSPCTVEGEIPPCPSESACIKKIEVNSVIQGLKKVLAL